MIGVAILVEELGFLEYSERFGLLAQDPDDPGVSGYFRKISIIQSIVDYSRTRDE